ncbi:uncharacterized protein LOC131881870 isoform X2 [Tigriopus californicus]|uniref:uncharacterized protein LOC131881870 isoform X2 n=1 Tax=Tigriopus californicus TaxID=6832 RepID=UPI0027DA1C4E|nr:uncharacterized protein LOC131881870 isoform X2 [Tigriopus californicus]
MSKSQLLLRPDRSNPEAPIIMKDLIDLHPSEHDMDFGVNNNLPDFLEEFPPTWHPPAVRDREEIDVKYSPWNDRSERREMGLKILPVFTMKEAGTIIERIHQFTRDFLTIMEEELKGRVLCIGKYDKKEDIEAHPVFQSFRDTIEKTGILIVDTEGPSQRRLKNHRIPLEAASSMVEVLQPGDILGNVIIIQTLQDCREEHTGCRCSLPCPKIGKKFGKKMGYTSRCPRDKGNHTSWQSQRNLKIHGFGDFPECVRSWLNSKSVFVVQSDVARHSGTFGDKERIDGLLASDCNSWVELHNIHAMFFGVSPGSCSHCQKEINPEEHRNHVIDTHGLSKYLEGRKFENGTLFELFKLVNPSLQLASCSRKNGSKIRGF